MKIAISAAILLLTSSLAAQRRFQVVSEDVLPGYMRNVYPAEFWELAAGLFGQTFGREMRKLVRLKLRSK